MFLLARCRAPWYPITHHYEPWFHVGLVQPLISRRRHIGPGALPCNESIPFEHVQVVDSETGAVGDLQPLKQLLMTIDRKESFVRMITADSPTVEVLEKKVELEKSKIGQQKGKARILTKEVGLSWGASPGDFDHKITKAHEELGKHRNRVKIVFAFKRKQVLVGDAEKDAILQTVALRLEDVGKEFSRTREGHLTTLVYHPKPLQK